MIENIMKYVCPSYLKLVLNFNLAIETDFSFSILFSNFSNFLATLIFIDTLSKIIVKISNLHSLAFSK